MLKVPDSECEKSAIEHALLLFLYYAGAQISEATALQVDNLQFNGQPRSPRNCRTPWQRRQSSSVPVVAENRESVWRTGMLNISQ